MARQAVLLQPRAPRRVPLKSAMSDETWADYHRAIWDSRLDAHLHARYFERVRRWLGAGASVLQLILVFGSGSTLLTLLVQQSKGLAIALTIAVTGAGILLQALKLPSRVERTVLLTEAWTVRCAFWDDAWLMVSDGTYLGSLSKLKEPEAELARIEAELNVPHIESFITTAAEQIEASDSFIRRRAST